MCALLCDVSCVGFSRFALQKVCNFVWHDDYFDGALVAQWIERCPTHLAVLSSSPVRGEIFSTVNVVPLHTAFHDHPPMGLI